MRRRAEGERVGPASVGRTRGSILSVATAVRQPQQDGGVKEDAAEEEAAAAAPFQYGGAG